MLLLPTNLFLYNKNYTFLVVIKSQKNFQCTVTELGFLIMVIFFKNNYFNNNIPFSTEVLGSCLKGHFSWNIQLEAS